MRISTHFKVQGRLIWKPAGYSLYLNEIRKNLAANLERSPLSHSYGYGSAGDRPTLFAGTPDRRFSLSFVPFVKFPG